MPAGYIDPNSGQYIYGTDDPRQPMHSVLNLAQNAAAIEAQQTRARLDQLEQWLGAFNAATPWATVTLNSTYFNTGLDPIGSQPAKVLSYRRVGDKVYVEGGANTGVVPPNWTHLGTLPLYFRPLEATPFVYLFGHSSDVNRGMMLPDGRLLLGQAPPAAGTDVTILSAQAFIV